VEIAEKKSGGFDSRGKKKDQGLFGLSSTGKGKNILEIATDENEGRV